MNIYTDKSGLQWVLVDELKQKLRELWDNYYTDKTDTALNNFFVEFKRLIKELESGVLKDKEAFK